MTEKNPQQEYSALSSSIAPWLSVGNSLTAVNFYKSAFGAVEMYRMEADGGLVVRLSVGGGEFWVSGQTTDPLEQETGPLGGESVRMLLTVSDPDTAFAKALDAGATQVFPVGEDFGWRLGRLVDPFGLHWEIGRELSS
jgi:PhnB protein